MNYKIVQIKWTDSYRMQDGWLYKEDFPEIVDDICYSIGYVVDETDKHIVISPHISNATEEEKYRKFDDTMVIPKCSIMEIININFINDKNNNYEIKID